MDTEAKMNAGNQKMKFKEGNQIYFRYSKLQYFIALFFYILSLLSQMGQQHQDQIYAGR
jgi:hypothetical protein